MSSPSRVTFALRLLSDRLQFGEVCVGVSVFAEMYFTYLCRTCVRHYHAQICRHVDTRTCVRSVYMVSTFHTCVRICAPKGVLFAHAYDIQGM